MKKKKKGPAKKRVGGFDRSKLNAAFMGNAREKKDETQGWSFDFNNQNAGMGGDGKVDDPDEDAIMKQVMAESLKDSKTSEDKPSDSGSVN